MYKFGVGKFVEESPWLKGLLDGNFAKRGLGIVNFVYETYVIECENMTEDDRNKVFVLKFEFGTLIECKTEYGTFNQYLMLIPTSDCADYVDFKADR